MTRLLQFAVALLGACSVPVLLGWRSESRRQKEEA